MDAPSVSHIMAITDFKTESRAHAAQEVLAWLEAGAPHKFSGLPGSYIFDMAEIVNPLNACGTACCIAGAIYQFERAGAQPERSLSATDLEAEFSFEYRDTLYELFYAEGRSLDGITASQAAIVFRYYLENGTVNWSDVLGAPDGDNHR